jgi:K+-transporting ATPase ATPase A chain
VQCHLLGLAALNGDVFVALLVGAIVIVGGLTFFPALALGPTVEHFAALTGVTY